ncbi:MAG: cobalamin biosynthesis protein [Candidatus Brocadiia bacterium]
MARTIIVTGRGGTGKTTFAALTSRFLPSPRLLIDADPDQCLGQMVGVDLADNDVNTVSDILYEIQGGGVSSELKSLPLAEKVDYLLNISCLYESEDFDLLTLGVKWTKGCYCAPNNILRAIIPELAQNYNSVVLDSPAGLEHLNRRVAPEAHDIFAIMDPSAKSLRNVRNCRDMAPQIGFSYSNLYTVANHRCREPHIERIKGVRDAEYLGRIDEDPAVLEADWEGMSLLELPAETPASRSVAQILQKAGYEVDVPQGVS